MSPPARSRSGITRFTASAAVVCPRCEREVERKELVRGHPWDGGFVLMEDADFDNAVFSVSAIRARG